MNPLHYYHPSNASHPPINQALFAIPEDTGYLYLVLKQDLRLDEDNTAVCQSCTGTHSPLPCCHLLNTSLRDEPSSTTIYLFPEPTERPSSHQYPQHQFYTKIGSSECVRLYIRFGSGHHSIASRGTTSASLIHR